MVKEILKKLNEFSNSSYIAIFTMDGFVVYEDGELEIEMDELIGEISKILGESDSFFLKRLGDIFEDAVFTMKSGRKILLYKLSDEYCVISILNRDSFVSKLKFYIEKEKSNILSKM